MQASVNQPVSRNSLALAFGCYLFWGVFPLYWKFLDHIEAVETLMHRIIWSFVFYAIILLLRYRYSDHKWQPLSAKYWSFAFITGILMAFNWGIYIYAVNISHIVEASLAYFISPLMSVAVGVVLFKEPFPPLLKFAFLMALAGVSIQIFFGATFPWIALSLATSFCIYGAFKKVIKTDAIQFIMLESAVLLIPSFIAAFYLREVATTALQSLDWIMLAGGGIITGIPLILFAMAAQKLPYSLMGMIQFIGPTLQFIIALTVFDEPFDNSQLITFALIWLGVGFYLIDRIRVARNLRKASNIPLATPIRPN